MWKIRITEWEKMDRENYLRILEPKTWVSTLKGLADAWHSGWRKESHESTYGEISDTRNGTS